MLSSLCTTVWVLKWHIMYLVCDTWPLLCQKMPLENFVLCTVLFQICYILFNLLTSQAQLLDFDVSATVTTRYFHWSYWNDLMCYWASILWGSLASCQREGWLQCGSIKSSSFLTIANNAAMHIPAKSNQQVKNIQVNCFDWKLHFHMFVGDEDEEGSNMTCENIEEENGKLCHHSGVFNYKMNFEGCQQ